MKSKGDRRYQELFESLNDAVYIVDVKTLQFTFLNNAVEKLTGYKKSEFLSMKVSDLIPPEYSSVVREMIQKKLEGQSKSTIYEVELKRKNGSRVPVEISSLARFDNGVPVEFLGIARDITERRLAQQQRDVMVSLVTHEIKNPLTTIVGFLDLLKKRLKTDKTARSYLLTIIDQTDSINTVMNDFLDVSQMRLGKLKIHLNSVDLDKLIKEVVKPFKIIRIVEIKGQIEGQIIADPDRIRQVLVNLLTNAMKYSLPDHPIAITLSKTHNQIRVEVTDLGQGISEGDQSHIFDLFVRGKNQSENLIKGHGLGLYVCKQIIKLHKGKIGVKSEIGKGSTFFFTLPIHK